MKNVRIYLLMPVFFNCIIFTLAEVFTAIDDMQSLLYVEDAVIGQLKTYIVDLENKVVFLKNRLKYYEEHHAEAAKDISQYLSNPINAFSITKRLTVQLEELIDKIDNGTIEEMFDKLKDVNNTELNLPTNEDLKGAAAAIIRIQDTYNLNALDIANGLFMGGLFNASNLTGADCYEIGYEAYNTSEYKLSIPWLKLALDKVEDGSFTDVESSLVQLLGYYSYSLHAIGNYTQSLQIMDILFELRPDDKIVIENKKILQQTMEIKKDKVKKIKITPIEKRKTKKWMDGYSSSQEEIYKRLCRKEITPTPGQIAPLRCRYITHNNSFLKIAPFKLEEASLDPYIVIFHDVVYDAEIEIIKKYATPHLERAAVDDENGTSLSGADITYRISKSAWLHNRDHKYIRDISLRIKDMTGLTLTYAEPLQIVNYGIGGHYEPHFDFALEGDTTYEKVNTGNRIATVLFYLSDVAEGGATVFPIIDIALWPQKGSAAFWYNLYASGVGDLRTKHAGCPVVIGSKWVANKWLHLRNQHNARPCKLTPDHPINK